MKNLSIQIIAIALFITSALACSDSADKSSSTEATTTETSEVIEVRTDGIAPILTGYLAMADALVAADSEGAVDAANSILAGLNKVDMSTIPADKTDEYTELAAYVKKSAEEIIEDVGHIDYQREHLEDLSIDMLALIDLLGTTQKLYKIHCPMAFDDKGADWLSASRDVRNPYFGDAMLTCGAVKAEFNP